MTAVSRNYGVARLLAILVVFASTLASCGGGSAEEAVTSTASTVALADLPPETCVPQGWAQEPLLAESLAVDPDIPIESLPDAEQIKAMDVVVGCFDRNLLVQSFDGITSPFDIPTQSAECLADVMISNQSGAAFVGFSHYTQNTPEVITAVDLRTPTMSALNACIPATLFAYNVALAPFYAAGQNTAVDQACVDRSYSPDQIDTKSFWLASYDQIVKDDNSEPTNRTLFEPAFYCVSFGQAYAASVKSQHGEDLSADTVACIDSALGGSAAESLLTTGNNQELINQAATGCLTTEERQTFGLGE